MIRELYQRRWTKSVIAKETGFDRKTIRKYIESDQLPQTKRETQDKAS